MKFTYKDIETATSGKWHNYSGYNTNVERGFKPLSLNEFKPLSLNEFKPLSTISTDTRADNKSALFLALSGVNFDAHSFLKEAVDSGAVALCLEEGRYERNKIPSHIPILEVQDTLKAYQDIANFHRKRLKELTLIAITGSNGKTSTKDILHNILSSEFGEESVYTTKANTNNLVGVPQNILNLTDKHRFAVIELGSNHPGEIRQLTEIANPDIAVITSIGPAHLEHFKDINGVIKEKTSIFTAYNNPQKGIAIIPEEHRGVLPKNNNYQIITFGKSEDADICWKHLNSAVEKSEFELHWKADNIKEKVLWNIPGIHQLSNAAAAATVATAVGIAPKNISHALHNSKISGMRMRINKRNDITWINDAYNANPTSTKAGIDWLHEIAKDALPSIYKRLFVILGDMLELGENAPGIHKEIIEYAVNKLPCSKVFGVGTIMHDTIKHAVEMDFKPISTFQNSEEAASFFKDELKAGDIVYLKGSRGIALEKIEKK